MSFNVPHDLALSVIDSSALKQQKRNIYFRNTYHLNEEALSYLMSGQFLNIYHFYNYFDTVHCKKNLLSHQEAPYLIDHSDRGFYGYVPVVLEMVKKVMEDELGLPFDYQMELVSDGDYGRYDAVENRWSGLMAKLTEGVRENIVEMSQYYKV